MKNPESLNIYRRTRKIIFRRIWKNEFTSIIAYLNKQKLDWWFIARDIPWNSINKREEPSLLFPIIYLRLNVYWISQPSTLFRLTPISFLIVVFTCSQNPSTLFVCIPSKAPKPTEWLTILWRWPKFFAVEGHDGWPSVYEMLPSLIFIWQSAGQWYYWSIYCSDEKKLCTSTRSTFPRVHIVSFLSSELIGFLIIPWRDNTHSSASQITPSPPSNTGISFSYFC